VANCDRFRPTSSHPSHPGPARPYRFRSYLPDQLRSARHVPLSSPSAARASTIPPPAELRVEGVEPEEVAVLAWSGGQGPPQSSLPQPFFRAMLPCGSFPSSTPRVSGGMSQTTQWSQRPARRVRVVDTRASAAVPAGTVVEGEGRDEVLSVAQSTFRRDLNRCGRNAGLVMFIVSCSYKPGASSRRCRVGQLGGERRSFSSVGGAVESSVRGGRRLLRVDHRETSIWQHADPQLDGRRQAP